MRSDVVLRPFQQMLVDMGLDVEYLMWCVDMGLGKTLPALRLIEVLYARHDICWVLVVGPKRVIEEVWTAEAAKWGFDHEVNVIAGTRQQRLAKIPSNALVHTVSYENLRWLVKVLGSRWPYDFVIVDESSGIKDYTTIRFKLLQALRHRFGRLLELTGTPSPNTLMNLWPQIYMLDGGKRLYPTITQFRNRYYERGYDGYTYTLRDGAEAEILAKCRDVCVSLKTEDYLVLPERIDVPVKIKLPPKAREQYDELEREYLLPFAGGDVEAQNAAVLVGKLLQVANGTVYDENKAPVLIHKAKYEALDEIIENASGPVIVAYGYKPELAEFKRRYGDRVRTPRDKGFMADWNAGRIEILATHPSQIGHGLNMQDAGNILVWFSMTYSLEYFLQLVKRIHRYRDNIELPAIIHYLIAEGTMDEVALETLAVRDATQDRFYAAVKARARELLQA